MLRIGRVTLREIQLALKEPFRISSGVMSTRRILLLELEDESGATAWSECVAFQLPIYPPETVDTAWLALREWLAPRIVGRPPPHPAAVHDILARDIRGHNMAKAALEMACWGLAAELERVPLSALLGGTRDRVPTGISVGIPPSRRATARSSSRFSRDRTSRTCTPCAPPSVRTSISWSTPTPRTRSTTPR